MITSLRTASPLLFLLEIVKNCNVLPFSVEEPPPILTNRLGILPIPSTELGFPFFPDLVVGCAPVVCSSRSASWPNFHALSSPFLQMFPYHRSCQLYIVVFKEGIQSTSFIVSFLILSLLVLPNILSKNFISAAITLLMSFNFVFKYIKSN